MPRHFFSQNFSLGIGVVSLLAPVTVLRQFYTPADSGIPFGVSDLRLQGKFLFRRREHAALDGQMGISQRSLQIESFFRLLLKDAVTGVH